MTVMEAKMDGLLRGLRVSRRDAAYHYFMEMARLYGEGTPPGIDLLLQVRTVTNCNYIAMRRALIRACKQICRSPVGACIFGEDEKDWDFLDMAVRLGVIAASRDSRPRFA